LDVILTRLRDNLAEPFRFQGSIYHVYANFGTAIYNDRFKQPADILNAAEKDLEQAQASAEENPNP